MATQVNLARARVRAPAGLLLLAALLSPAVASDFQVLPNALNLSAGEKSGAFSVVNGSGEKINLQISVKEWAQDEQGRDVYTDTAEIVFFPKIMTVAPYEQRAVRIGMKVPPSLKEKTFKLFVEEIPAPGREQEEKPPGKIRTKPPRAFPAAAQIFVAPFKPRESAVVAGMSMAGGTVTALIRNTGNVHIRLLGVHFIGRAADGKEVLARESAGRYLLNGLTWGCEITLPKEPCGSLAAIDVKAHAGNLTITGTLDVQKHMCAQ